MANRRYTYTIGIEADTSQFKAQLKEAIDSLEAVGKIKTLVPSVQAASSEAKKLAQYLRDAVDTNTGKFNLATFEESLSKSGRGLKDYQNALNLIGPSGAEAFQNVTEAILQAEQPLRRSNKLVSDLWVTLKNTVRWQITNKMVNTFTGALETAYGYSKDLDRSLNSIRIVTGDSAEEMREFSKQANEAAKALSATTTDYTEAALIYAQQGLQGDAMVERTDITIKAANVTGQTAKEVSEQLTAIWNNFNDGSKSLEYYVDVITALGTSTASSSDEISAGIQKFAAVSNTVGLSYEYAASALATLVANTREAPEVIGNALRTLFARIQGLQLGETLDDGTDLNKYSKALAAVGVDIKDVNGELKGMDQILDETHEAWTTISKDQQTALAQTVAGILY